MSDLIQFVLNHPVELAVLVLFFAPVVVYHSYRERFDQWLYEKQREVDNDRANILKTLDKPRRGGKWPHSHG